MSTLSAIEINRLTLDPRLQFRLQENAEVKQEWADRLKEGATFPPIIVYKDEAGAYWVADGHHRVDAHRLAGIEKIWAEIRHGEFSLAQEHAAAANEDHGLRRTIYDKQKAAEWWIGVYLPQHPDLKIRELARRAKLSHTFLNDTRAKLAAKAAEPVVETLAEVPEDLGSLDDQTLGRIACRRLRHPGTNSEVYTLERAARLALEERAHAKLLEDLAELPIVYLPTHDPKVARLYSYSSPDSLLHTATGPAVQISAPGGLVGTVLLRVWPAADWEETTWTDSNVWERSIADGAPLEAAHYGRQISTEKATWIVGFATARVMWAPKPAWSDDGQPQTLTAEERAAGVPLETPEDLARRLTRESGWPGYQEPQNSAAKAGEAAARAGAPAEQNPHPEGSQAWAAWWAAWWLASKARGPGSPYVAGYCSGLTGQPYPNNPYCDAWDFQEWARGLRGGASWACEREAAIRTDRQRAICKHGAAYLPGGEDPASRKLLTDADIARMEDADLGRRRARLIGAFRARTGARPDWVAESKYKEARVEALPGMELEFRLDPWPAMSFPGVICAYCAIPWDARPTRAAPLTLAPAPAPAEPPAELDEDEEEDEIDSDDQITDDNGDAWPEEVSP